MTFLAMLVYLIKLRHYVGSTNSSSILVEIPVKSLSQEKVLEVLAFRYFSWHRKQEVKTFSLIYYIIFKRVI
jgi:hypothetical protein